MKKKHRDIEVNGKTYGWTLKFGKKICIWYDKKIVFETTVEVDEIKPKLISELIIKNKL